MNKIYRHLVLLALLLLGLVSCSKEQELAPTPVEKGNASELTFQLGGAALRSEIEAQEVAGSQRTIEGTPEERKVSRLDAIFFSSNGTFAKSFEASQRGATEWFIPNHQLVADTYKIVFVANAGSTLQTHLGEMKVGETTYEAFKAFVSDQDPGLANHFLMVSQEIIASIQGPYDSKQLPEVKLERASVRFDFVNHVQGLVISSITYKDRFVQTQLSTPGANLSSATDSKIYTGLVTGMEDQKTVQRLHANVYAYENLNAKQVFVIKGTHGGKEINDITIKVPTKAIRNYLYTIELRDASGSVDPENPDEDPKPDPGTEPNINVYFHVYDWNDGTEIYMSDEDLEGKGSSTIKNTYTFQLEEPIGGSYSVGAKPTSSTIPYKVKAEVTMQKYDSFGNPEGNSTTKSEDYSVISNADWVHVNGKTITVDENTSSSERQATVTFELLSEEGKAATQPLKLTINQAGGNQTISYEYAITITNPAASGGKHTLNVGPEASVQTFSATATETKIVTTNGVESSRTSKDVSDKIKASSTSNWLDVAGPTINVSANTGSAAREGQVNITLSGVEGTPPSKTIYVAQTSGTNPNMVGNTPLSNVGEYNVDRNGFVTTSNMNDNDDVYQWSKALSFFEKDSEGVYVLKRDNRYYLPTREQWAAIVPLHAYVYFNDQSPDRVFDNEETVVIGTKELTNAKSDYYYSGTKTYAVRFKGTEFMSIWMYEYIDNPDDDTGKALKISCKACDPNVVYPKVVTLKDSDFTGSDVDVRVFPASGDRSSDNEEKPSSFGTHGYYWSATTNNASSYNTKFAYHMSFEWTRVALTYHNKTYYNSVRPFVRNH